MPRVLVAEVLRHPRPVNIRHQRRIFQAQGLHQFAGAQHHLVVFNLYRRLLCVDTFLAAASTLREAERHHHYQ